MLEPAQRPLILSLDPQEAGVVTFWDKCNTVTCFANGQCIETAVACDPNVFEFYDPPDGGTQSWPIP